MEFATFALNEFKLKKKKLLLIKTNIAITAIITKTATTATTTITTAPHKCWLSN